NKFSVQVQTLKQYLRRDYTMKLTVNLLGYTMHDSCISHCLQHAFGDCSLVHSETCENCENLGEEAGFILARSLPGLRPWKKYTPVQIIKITKDHIFKKPEPLLSEHTTPPKYWAMPTPHIQSWALAENKKNNQKEPWKRMTKQIRSLLENMFYAGTVDNNNKISGEEMYEKLLKRAQRDEFDQNDIPKVSTINNWIATFSRK
ncbi:13891_t:CDS:2, partial [Gigaspora rosea]